jgi:hypothetical protein
MFLQMPRRYDFAADTLALLKDMVLASSQSLVYEMAVRTLSRRQNSSTSPILLLCLLYCVSFEVYEDLRKTVDRNMLGVTTEIRSLASECTSPCGVEIHA